MSELFSPYRLRGLEMRNRVVVAPMCQYSAVDGVPDDWHLVHLGSFARGGAALVITEATAVTPEGRISPGDTGLWNDAQQAAWARIVDFVHAQGALAGIQLAHAGRKASSRVPFDGRGAVPDAEGGWEPVAPSAVTFGDLRDPREMTAAEVAALPGQFVAAARRAVAAGFDVLEIHAAHGYLLHQFLSPLANHRTDAYGGPFDHRARLTLEVVRAVRAALPEVPLLVRLSATDWAEGGWDVDDTVRLSALLKEAGADLVDTSSGGTTERPSIPVAPGYQVPFARRIRAEAGIATGAVGLITEPAEAERVVADGDADLVLLGRELLRDPHWPLRAAHALGVPATDPGAPWPKQYARAARV
ncbi:NADH:flavin oxidoreductase/NADH oxidase [Georgenia faecalis]|uniref:NADH:flavin oxidoreductase/NADH oxidase n=1 Tax=Georgenia faecalis TaxID=2483799 RepID=UPI000FDA9EB6|nr:NADH:flavin oxidoreductase/NADH oxidase [Georgenia faecalis]